MLLCYFDFVILKIQVLVTSIVYLSKYLLDFLNS